MSDAVLKIYSTTTTWGDTLDHTLFGDVLDYKVSRGVDPSGDSAFFKINDQDGQWSDEIEPDVWTGAAESTQKWACFNRAGTLLGSGVINDVKKVRDSLHISGGGLGDILKRRVIQNQIYQTLDNAGAAVEGEWILTNATYGLLPIYLSTTYGTIDYTTYTTAPDDSEPRVWNFDGVNLMDACYEVSRGSYGSNSDTFYAYLMETESGGVFTKYFVFKEWEADAKSKTIKLSDIEPNSFNISEHKGENYNTVIVNGSVDQNYKYNDGTTYGLFGDTTDWDFAEEGSGAAVNGLANTGLYYDGAAVEADRSGSAADEQMIMFRENFTALENTVTLIKFALKAKHFDDADAQLALKIYLGVKDKYGNATDIDDATAPPSMKCDLNVDAIASSRSYGSTDWTEYELLLPKPNNSYDWSNTTLTFANSGIELREWKQIYQIGFHLDDDAGEDIEYLAMCNLHAVGPKTFSGSAPAVPTTYRRDYIYTDRGLKSDEDCSNMAANILTGLNKKQYSGSVTLMGTGRDASLQPGNTVEVVVPSHGVYIRAGETPAKLGIERIVYTPMRQTLMLGSVLSTSDIINRISRKTKLNMKV